MNEIEINRFANFLFKKYFNEELTIPININNRLKRVHAWFVVSENPYIEISRHLVQQSIYIIADIVLHELTHYYLYKNNKPYDDEDIEFRSLTYKNGISHTQTAKTCGDGLMRYEHWKYESRCDCGFKITSFLPVNSTDIKQILICPNCNTRLSQQVLGIVYKDYAPPFRLEMYCKEYLENEKRTNEEN